ncbi:unnamed protein product [Prorocentrum cordatum]|uniref:Uncharacterized protein n=1 Tax=Prorocentrum cordatum TaxID=2364126 RepID=A0ABN9T1C6_9DINO|nr:unnamed protein product [Polarella glacialis]
MHQKDQHIPAFIFKHPPRFKRRVEQHVQQTSWEYLSVTRAWQTCKGIMVNAAQETRNELIQLPIGDSSEGAEDARRLTMRSIARCVWLQDARLASRLVATTQLGRKYLMISETDDELTPRITFTDQQDFEHYTGMLNIAWAERQQAQAAERLQRRQQHGEFAWLNLAVSSKIRIAPVISRSPSPPRDLQQDPRCDGDLPAGIARRPEDIIQAIAAHWEPIFRDTRVDEDAIDRYLDEHMPARASPNIDIPSISDMRRVLARVSDSAPGPDRLPYSAWQANDKFVECLFGMMLHIFAGHPVPPGLNYGDLVMLPKGDEFEDRVEILRHPHAVRPLLLKNTDSKLLAATINLKLKTVAQQEVHVIQQGFIPQRQFIQHVAQLDAQSRIASNQLDAVEAKPCFISFDVKELAHIQLGREQDGRAREGMLPGGSRARAPAALQAERPRVCGWCGGRLAPGESLAMAEAGGLLEVRELCYLLALARRAAREAVASAGGALQSLTDACVGALELGLLAEAELLRLGALPGFPGGLDGVGGGATPARPGGAGAVGAGGVGVGAALMGALAAPAAGAQLDALADGAWTPASVLLGAGWAQGTNVELPTHNAMGGVSGTALFEVDEVGAPGAAGQCLSAQFRGASLPTEATRLDGAFPPRGAGPAGLPPLCARGPARCGEPAQAGRAVLHAEWLRLRTARGLVGPWARPSAFGDRGGGGARQAWGPIPGGAAPVRLAAAALAGGGARARGVGGHGRRRRRNESGSRSDGDGEPRFRDAPSRGGSARLLAERQPGALYDEATQSIARVMGLRGGAGGSETRPKVVGYLQAIVFGHPVSQLRVDTARELQTLATALDLLESGSLPQVCDILTQRFKALEISLSDASWQVASELEIVPDARPPLASMDEQGPARRSAVLRRRLQDAKSRGAFGNPGRGGERARPAERETCQLLGEQVHQLNMAQGSDEEARAVERRKIGNNVVSVAELANDGSQDAHRLPEPAKLQVKAKPKLHLRHRRSLTGNTRLTTCVSLGESNIAEVAGEARPPSLSGNRPSPPPVPSPSPTEVAEGGNSAKGRSHSRSTMDDRRLRRGGKISGGSSELLLDCIGGALSSAGAGRPLRLQREVSRQLRPPANVGCGEDIMGDCESFQPSFAPLVEDMHWSATQVLAKYFLEIASALAIILAARALDALDDQSPGSRVEGQGCDAGSPEGGVVRLRLADRLPEAAGAGAGAARQPDTQAAARGSQDPGTPARTETQRTWWAAHREGIVGTAEKATPPPSLPKARHRAGATPSLGKQRGA